MAEVLIGSGNTVGMIAGGLLIVVMLFGMFGK